MPGTMRVPLSDIAHLDPHFRIDIRDPTNGAVGLRVGSVADKAAFERTYRPRPGSQSQKDILFNGQLWATFLHAKLGESSWHIEGLDAVRGDLVPPTNDPQFCSQAWYAYIPGPHNVYEGLKEGATQSTVYFSLRPLLADIIACQVVWYQRLLHLCPGQFEKQSTKSGYEGHLWRLWRFASHASPNLNHLDALYIVSIRRFEADGRWVYIPEVEIRSEV